MSESQTAINPVTTARQRDIFEDIWALFVSRRLAIVLILAISIASLAGALLQQAPAEVLANPEALRSWVERVRPKYGFFTDIFRFLGFLWIFQSAGFRALLGLLAINITVCTAGRVPELWRHVFQPTVRPAEGLFERGRPRETVQFPAPSLGIAADRVQQVLRRNRLRIKETAEAGAVYLYADRNSFARFGTLVNHGAMVLVLAGATLSGPLGFWEENGFAVTVGTTREVGHNSGLSIYVEEFVDEYYPSGPPKDYRSEAVLYENGQEVARQTIRVNEPLVYKGIRFHQSYYGNSAVVSIADARGEMLFRGPVPLTYRTNEGDRPLGYVDIPGRDLHVYVVATAGQNRTTQIVDSRIQPGELAVEAYRGSARTPAYQALLTQRQPQTVGDLQFTFEREVPFTGLRIVKDPGEWIVYAAFALIVLGVGMAFYFPHRRLWVRIRADGEGARVTLVGAGRELAGELQRLSQQLQTRLAAQLVESIPWMAHVTREPSSRGPANPGARPHPRPAGHPLSMCDGEGDEGGEAAPRGRGRRGVRRRRVSGGKDPNDPGVRRRNSKG